MHHPNILKSSGAKVAGAFFLMYAVITALTVAVSLSFVDRDLDAWLDKTISETAGDLIRELREGGTAELVKSIDEHVQSADSDNEVYLLVDRDLNKLAGNVKSVSVPSGWSDLAPNSIGLEGDRSFRVLATKLGGNTLIVGRSDVAVEEISGLLERISFVGGAAMAIGGLSAALFLGWQMQRRVERFAGALEAIGHGDLLRRVDVPNAGGDDLDTIARRLNAALDLLHAAVSAMQHVTVDIAHDLRGPIARVRMRIAEALRERTADSTNLEEALTETDQIAHTFDSLLRIAQIEAGERRLNFGTVDLSALVERLSDLYAPLMEDRGGRIALSLESSGHIEGDAQLITQLITNLIENTISHAQPGASMRLRTRNSDDAHITLSVEDNGPGIPAGERANVLQRFYRLDKSRSSPGNGLGLALVAAVADLHAATLRLDDNRPGLAVTLRFPASPPASFSPQLQRSAFDQRDADSNQAHAQDRSGVERLAIDKIARESDEECPCAGPDRVGDADRNAPQSHAKEYKGHRIS